MHPEESSRMEQTDPFWPFHLQYEWGRPCRGPRDPSGMRHEHGTQE